MNNPSLIAQLFLHAAALVYLAATVWMRMETADRPELPSEYLSTFHRALVQYGWMVGLPFALAFEVLAWGLRKRRFWAWVGSICACGIFFGSVFFPLAAVALWSLVRVRTREHFGIRAEPIT
ncbi:MAG: hypothetical protein DHS20C15_35000 [Planctomycetota bacterium]|nr:MAG: hypothetical protein DHS20C15_35000 [Planctomycetota bacterium]